MINSPLRHLLYRLRQDSSGMVTVEAALALVALMTVAIFCIAGLGAGFTQLRLADAAQATAREVSRGNPSPNSRQLTLPAQAHISVSTEAGRVNVSVTAPAPLLPFTLRAETTLPLERIVEEER